VIGEVTGAAKKSSCLGGSIHDYDNLIGGVETPTVVVTGALDDVVRLQSP
jgi:hypothetical protein